MNLQKYGSKAVSRVSLFSVTVVSTGIPRKAGFDAWDAALFTFMEVAARKFVQRDGELIKVETFRKE